MVGQLIILGPKGDTRVEFDTEAEDTVRAAEEIFNQHRVLGFAAYTTDPSDPRHGAQVTKFDPLAETTVLFLPMVGG